MRVVIVGGGITGSSLYLILKKSGFDVILIDSNVKRKPFPTLIHSLLLKDKDVELAKLSLDFYKKFKILYRDFRSYTIGKIDSRLLNLWNSVGVELNEKYIDWLNTNAIEAIGGDRLVSISGLINLTERIITNPRIEVKNDKGFLKIGNSTHEVDIIILAAGAWSKYIINVSLPVKTYYCWAMSIISNKRQVGEFIIYDYVNYFYSRPIVGLGLPFAIAGNGKSIESSPYDKVCIADKEEVIRKISNRLGFVKELYTNGNFCEATMDMRPAYGKVAENVYYIGGLNGYGAEVGPGLATVLSSEILSNKELDNYKEYRIDRFSRFNDDFEIGKEPHEL